MTVKIVDSESKFYYLKIVCIRNHQFYQANKKKRLEKFLRQKSNKLQIIRIVLIMLRGYQSKTSYLTAYKGRFQYLSVSIHYILIHYQDWQEDQEKWKTEIEYFDIFLYLMQSGQPSFDFFLRHFLTFWHPCQRV